MKRLISVFAICLLLLSCGCKKEKKSLYETGVAAENESVSQETESESSQQETSSVPHSDKETSNTESTNSTSSETETSSKVEVSYAGDEVVKQPKPEIQPPSLDNVKKLTNTLKILQSGETLRVVYYGGSVTGGTGASNAQQKSWRALTTEYLKTFGEVFASDKAIGGTGSYCGMVRFNNDVIEKKPDLIFIEFAINDKYNGISEELATKDLEYMIRTLNAHNPYADIVLVLVTDKTSFGKGFAAYNAVCKVSAHYNIPCVDLGMGLYDYLGGSATKLAEYLTDSVHPNDKGYKVYADVMQAALKKLLTGSTMQKHALPATLLKNGFNTVSILKNATYDPLKIENLDQNQWGKNSWGKSKEYEKADNPLTKSAFGILLPSYLYPKTTESTMTFKFTGNSLGMLGTIKANAKLIITLDSKDTVTLEGSDTVARMEYPLFDNIENKEHTVTVKVSGEKPYIAIAAFITTN